MIPATSIWSVSFSTARVARTASSKRSNRWDKKNWYLRNFSWNLDQWYQTVAVGRRWRALEKYEIEHWMGNWDFQLSVRDEIKNFGSSVAAAFYTQFQSQDWYIRFVHTFSHFMWKVTWRKMEKFSSASSFSSQFFLYVIVNCVRYFLFILRSGRVTRRIRLSSFIRSAAAKKVEETYSNIITDSSREVN